MAASMGSQTMDDDDDDDDGGGGDDDDDDRPLNSVIA